MGWGFWLLECRQTTNTGGIHVQIKLIFLGIIAMPLTPQHVRARPWKKVDS
jgi:hypothetical protein